MTKTEKKIEATIVAQLTLACKEAKTCTQGFEWLTHEVNFKSFPKSLLITCIFDDWNHATDNENQLALRRLCKDYLAQVKIPIKVDQVQFSVE